MSQRNSTYARKLNDFYATPRWVTDALLPHLPDLDEVWEPAAGDGSMARVLRDAGLSVLATELAPMTGFPILVGGKYVGVHKAGFGPIYRQDFFRKDFAPKRNIVSNPPFTRCTVTAEWLIDRRGFLWRPNEAKTVPHLGPFEPVSALG